MPIICRNCGYTEISSINTTNDYVDKCFYCSIKEDIKPTTSILIEADNIVNGPRQDAYADPLVCMQRTIDIFNAITGLNLKRRHIAIMNIAQKLAREANKHNKENLLDLAGYTEIWHRIEENEK